jgi:hypothetical protein
MDVELIVRELDKPAACDLGYADGESDETNEWFSLFTVKGPVVDLIVPDRPPEATSASSDGHEWWWTLPDGTIVGRFYNGEDTGSGLIIPPDAGDPRR